MDGGSDVLSLVTGAHASEEVAGARGGEAPGVLTGPFPSDTGARLLGAGGHSFGCPSGLQRAIVSKAASKAPGTENACSDREKLAGMQPPQ